MPSYKVSLVLPKKARCIGLRIQPSTNVSLRKCHGIRIGAKCWRCWTASLRLFTLSLSTMTRAAARLSLYKLQALLHLLRYETFSVKVEGELVSIGASF